MHCEDFQCFFKVMMKEEESDKEDHAHTHLVLYKDAEE